MKDVMIDLETWGRSSGCAGRSIGAVEYELDGRVGSTFYRNISDMSSWTYGLRAERDTAEWWSQQNEAAKGVFSTDRVGVLVAVQEFNRWFRSTGATHVWSQGACFDIPIWEAIAKAVGETIPWKFWNIQDTRTIYRISGFDPRSIEREGIAHHALDDAKHQVRCVQAAWARLTIREKQEAA